MPLEIRDEGHDNIVDIEPGQLENLNGVITLRGDGSRVSIASPFVVQALNIDVAAQSTVQIDAGCFAGALTVYARRHGHVSIGRGSSFNGATRVLLHEPGEISIGRNCLFGPDIDVVNSDMHSLVDVKTGARLNSARDVVVGDHVWIGIKSFVAKGARIGSDSVIGAYSFVSGHIPSQCLAVGVPARVIREGVSWTFDLIDTPQPEMMSA